MYCFLYQFLNLNYEEGPSSSPEEVTDQGLDSLPAIVPVDEIEQVLVQEPELDPVPAIVQEEEVEPVPDLEDPLALSPLLVDMGFGRVQEAYEHWLRNMSHAVSLFQG